MRLINAEFYSYNLLLQGEKNFLCETFRDEHTASESLKQHSRHISFLDCHSQNKHKEEMCILWAIRCLALHLHKLH